MAPGKSFGNDFEKQKAHEPPPPKNPEKKTRYVDENTVNFVVMNKVGGFLQRIDYARKCAFGAMCILKDDKGQFPIRGAWIFRGQAIPPMMVEVRSWSWCFAFACPRAPHISYNLNRKEEVETMRTVQERGETVPRSPPRRRRKEKLTKKNEKKTFQKKIIFHQECYDLDLYNWTKVNVNNAEQKKRVEDMFAEEAKIDGLEHIECKIFK